MVSLKPYKKENDWWSTLHILPLYALCKQVNLHIFDTKYKINTYNKYSTRYDKCVSIWSWPPSAKRITRLKPSYSIWKNFLRWHLFNIMFSFKNISTTKTCRQRRSRSRSKINDVTTGEIVLNSILRKHRLKKIGGQNLSAGKEIEVAILWIQATQTCLQRRLRLASHVLNTFSSCNFSQLYTV